MTTQYKELLIIGAAILLSGCGEQDTAGVVTPELQLIRDQHVGATSWLECQHGIVVYVYTEYLDHNFMPRIRTLEQNGNIVRCDVDFTTIQSVEVSKVNKYKELPNEPTEEKLGESTVLSQGFKQWNNSIKSYRETYERMLEPEQEPVNLRFPTMLRKMWSSSEVQEWIDNQQPLYTHPQADQTKLINQLTDELNKTEVERVKWMTMALTSQPKRATKDHEIAKFVTELTVIANEYQGTQQLRNRLRGIVLSFVEKYKHEPLNEIELKQIFEQSIGLKYWDFARAIEKAHGIGV
jgi:hypothetical protein